MRLRMILAAGVAVLSGPAAAECLGSCMDGLVGALVAMLVYGGLGIAVLVMLIREKWRRGGVRLLAAVAVLAVGVPLVSQAWVWAKLRAMEGREIAGRLPELAEKVPLLISDSIMACYYDACALVLEGRGEAGVVALPIEALAGRAAGAPLDLAALPLELWQAPEPGSSETRSRPLSDAERQAAAERIDYLILVGKPWFADLPGPVETVLSQRPELLGMRASEGVNLVLGPIGGGKLDLLGMKLDLLDLWLADRALALILAPYNTQEAGNEIANRDAVAAQLCTRTALAQGWDCDYALR